MATIQHQGVNADRTMPQENDNLRKQWTKLSKKTRTYLMIDTLEEQICHLFARVVSSESKIIIQSNEQNYKVTTSIIKSLPGCMQQNLHTDYPERGESAVESFIAILALQDGTKLTVIDNNNKDNIMISRDISIRKHSLIVARGDFVHAGSSAYDLANIRLHFYIETKSNFNKFQNKTYYLLKSITDTFDFKSGYNNNNDNDDNNENNCNNNDDNDDNNDNNNNNNFVSIQLNAAV
jgi:hypothetical protein